MSRKILILGAASYQLPVIYEAQNRGYHVIVCSNNNQDPGINIADEYYEISIADHDAVIKLAKKIKPIRVIGYVSETAMHAAFIVNKALGLSNTSEQVVRTFTRKDLFRNFQASNKFPHPKYVVASKIDNISIESTNLTYPIIVKPVDSCGSRGVSRVDIEDNLNAALEYAWHHSAKNLAIVEEVVSAQNRQFTGDGFVVNGQLKFLSYGEHLFDDQISNVTACGSFWPANVSKSLSDDIFNSINDQVAAIGYKEGPFNIDFRLNQEGKTIIIEISPRNGANYFPQLIKYCTGVDLVSALFDVLEGITPSFETNQSNYAVSLILYSEKDGTLDSVSIASKLDQWILQKEFSNQGGDQVKKFQHLGNSLGVLNFGFESEDAAKNVIKNRENLVNVILKST